MTHQEAIARLYDTTGHLVLRRCMQMLRDPQEARDATQWVYLRAIETGFEVRSTEQSLSWLYQTAVRRCLWVLRNRRHRGRLRHIHREELMGMPSPSAEGRTIDRDLLERCLAQLDERTGEIALMTWGMGLSNDRVAQLLEVSTRTVGRARAQFESHLRYLAGEEAS